MYLRRTTHHHLRSHIEQSPADQESGVQHFNLQSHNLQLKMSSTSLYIKDKLVVPVELYQAVDMQFFDNLKAIFESDEWLYQELPVPQQMLKRLCPRNHVTDQFVCAFCPGVTFTQPGRALEHIQQHFGLRPFQCTAPDW